ncbi:MAG TPA: hypothetical protein V6C58_18810 [Allocoleopsis sp.]
MKNENFDKKDYKLLKKVLKTDPRKTRFVSVRELRANYNGLTIAYRNATENTDCRMLHVAVSYCAPEDTFCKKTGKYQAAIKLEQGEFVQIPVVQEFKKFSWTNRNIKDFLLEMFAV